MIQPKLIAWCLPRLPREAIRKYGDTTFAEKDRQDGIHVVKLIEKFISQKKNTSNLSNILNNFEKTYHRSRSSIWTLSITCRYQNYLTLSSSRRPSLSALSFYTFISTFHWLLYPHDVHLTKVLVCEVVVGAKLNNNSGHLNFFNILFSFLAHLHKPAC